ncbi:MAG: hypothetical protein IPL46_20535 [Saprospiraceae bacterium]|nr:hypothetical protein [Saprospiraceae bacterium]
MISFLFAHIFYLVIFSKGFKTKQRNLGILVGSTVIFLFIWSYFFTMIRHSLGSLLIPVMCYMLVILTMALMAINRISQSPTHSYSFVSIGAVLFCYFGLHPRA